MLIKLVTSLVLLFCCVNSKKFNFTNYALYKVIPSNVEELGVLDSMTNNPELDFFDDPVSVDELVTVVTSPAYRKTFEEILKANNIDAEVSIENIQSAIEKQTIGKYVKSNIKSMTWDAYYILDDIYSWLNDIAASNSDVVSLINGGVSYEGREIKGVKISHGNGRRNIFIEGGIHAREWISYTTVNYIINELLYSQDPETVAASRDFDWYIFPCTNPDGYVWTHTDYRLWRKNRKPVGSQFGIDLNRNWNSNWLLKSSSTNPSSNNYAGSGPFSEIETRTLSAFIESVADTMDMYISFHSSGQMLMVPFGNTTDPLDNYYDSVRLWSKNRRPTRNNQIGVDLTKNWNSQWGVHGGSFSPADANFIGIGPFSEPETRAVSNYIETIGHNLAGVLSFREFGQKLLIPFAHTTEPLDNYEEMIVIGRRAMGSLSVKYNTNYQVGTSAAVHDGATGMLVDWAKYRFRPPVAATYHLRDTWGYVLPVAQVLPSCEETFDSVMAIIREARFLNVL